jgi:hypothetical protein
MTIGDNIERRLREQLAELESLEATGRAPPDTPEHIDSIQYLLALRGKFRPAEPTHYGKARSTLADFEMAADKWGNA